MADRSAAEIFGTIFIDLAYEFDSVSGLRGKAAIERIAKKTFSQAKHYDFSWQQMNADEALAKLGLAKLGDSGYAEEYGPQ